MECLHKIVYWFESRRNENSLDARLESELTGITNSLKNDFFQPNAQMGISSKLAAADWLPSDIGWEWYGKITSTEINDFNREVGTKEAADEIARRMLVSLESDPFTVGTPQRVK